mgnify:CR=1 FL=1
MFGLNTEELKVLKRLNTPVKIQDFLDTLRINFEEDGETVMSPRRVLQTRKAHCMEAALFAAAVLWLHKEEPLLLDLKALPFDDDHVITLYKKKGFWGAISKSNHASLRFRDPVYASPREIALSYFHEYFENKKGRKTLDSYSRPFDLKKYGSTWITSEEELWHIPEDLDSHPHYKLVAKTLRPLIRKADKMELRAGRLVEWGK